MSSSPCLLILDYPGRRPEAHLDELGLEDLGFECRYLLARPMPDELATARYARRLADASQVSGGNVCAVLSYCAAAPLATELAELVGGEGPVPVVMLDPFDIVAQDIVGQYATVVRQIEGGGPTGDSPPLLDVAAEISRPRTLAAKIEHDLAARAKRSLDVVGDELDADELAANVVSMYLDWLKFLLAVYHRPDDVSMGAVLRVVSRQEPPSPQWLGAGKAHTAKIDCEHADLARSPETRQVIKEFLERWR